METAASVLDRATLLIWEAGWQGTVLIALVFVCTGVLRTHLAPSCRFALWGVVFVRLVLPAVPGSSWSLFILSESSPEEQRTLAAIDAPEIQPWVPEIAVTQPEATLPATPNSSVPPRTSERFDVAPARHPMSFLQMAGIVWLSGVVLLTARIVCLVAALHRKSREWKPAAARLEAIFQSCRCQAGVRRGVRLRIANEDFGPAVYGVVSPVVILPESILATMSEADFRHVFVHELAHVRRHDALVHWLTLVARTLHWFNPFVHLAAARMLQERELACDAAALRAMGTDQRRPYGETLIRLSERIAPAGFMPGLVGVFSARSRLRERVLRIAGVERSSRLWTAIGAVLVGSLVLVGLTGPLPADAGVAQTISNKEDNVAVQEEPRGEARDFHLEGACRDQDGQPLSGVTMRLFMRRASGTDPTSRDLVGHADTGADGTFRFESLERSYRDLREGGWLEYELVAKKAGHATVLKHLRADSEAEPLALTLRAAAMVRGQVTDVQGAPVPGALVTWSIVSDPVDGIWSATTNSEGRYEITDFYPFEEEDLAGYRQSGVSHHTGFKRVFRVQHPDFAPAFVGIACAPITADVRLISGGAVEGRVVDLVAEDVGRGIEVRLQGGSSFIDRTIRSDDSGSYTFTGLAEGEYTVTVRTPDLVSFGVDSLAVKHGETTEAPVLELVRGGIVRGRIIDDRTGEAQVRDSTGRRICIAVQGPAFDVAPIQDDGTFTLRVAPGEVVINSTSPYMQPPEPNLRRNPLVVKDGDEIVVDFHFGKTPPTLRSSVIGRSR